MTVSSDTKVFDSTSGIIEPVLLKCDVENTELFNFLSSDLASISEQDKLSSAW